MWSPIGDQMSIFSIFFVCDFVFLSKHGLQFTWWFLGWVSGCTIFRGVWWRVWLLIGMFMIYFDCGNNSVFWYILVRVEWMNEWSFIPIHTDMCDHIGNELHWNVMLTTRFNLIWTHWIYSYVWWQLRYLTDRGGWLSCHVVRLVVSSLRAVVLPGYNSPVK